MEGARFCIECGTPVPEPKEALRQTEQRAAEQLREMAGEKEEAEREAEERSARILAEKEASDRNESEARQRAEVKAQDDLGPPNGSQREDSIDNTIPTSPDPTDVVDRPSITMQVNDLIEGYFRQTLHGNETCPICLVGCGQAGTEMVGFFRLKPDFVTAYTAEYYPVRAAAFDTQSALGENLKKKFHIKFDIFVNSFKHLGEL